ncbi:uncharacterized protein LAESUDRAFT_549109 [Laetiporus sulphureus 93-53]|uniref:Uncharacterized protein n=1 Tax=Laetiporus sulphureus 93-53 TaxID=1314785 RepID=A0A165FSC0_9APHY|nr:uncharacterized protein LAESUDRAFT_549109 [Laetiporus sulphureus 93-53]KZT09348.1 hypothetical protein LAESUDRAFT_549109 [Laetiporus sulphureus 93-53]
MAAHISDGKLSPFLFLPSSSAPRPTTPAAPLLDLFLLMSNKPDQEIYPTDIKHALFCYAEEMYRYTLELWTDMSSRVESVTTSASQSQSQPAVVSAAHETLRTRQQDH